MKALITLKHPLYLWHDASVVKIEHLFCETKSFLGRWIRVSTEMYGPLTLASDNIAGYQPTLKKEVEKEG